MDVEALCRETALHLFGDLRGEAAIQAGIRQVRPTVEFVAAQVRAEAKAEHRAEQRRWIEVGQQLQAEKRVAEAERDEYRRNWQESEKRVAKAVAEAVADERRRIAVDIRARKYDEAPFIGAAGPEACSLAGVRTFNAALEECASAVERGAAGSVPVATPPDYFVITTHPDGSLTTAPGPVATPTEPEWRATSSGRLLSRNPDRIERRFCGCVTGWDDAYEQCVLIHCGRHSVATPAEPEGRSGQCGVYEAAGPIRRCRLDAGHHGRCHLTDQGSASPVLAEQPLSASDHTDLLGVAISDAMAEQLEER